MDTKKISLSHDEVAIILDALHHLRGRHPGDEAYAQRDDRLREKLREAADEMSSGGRVYEYDLVRRDTGERYPEPVNNAREAARFLLHHCYDDAQAWREKAVLVLLSAAGRAMGWFTLGVGGSTACTMDFRAAVTAALEAGASRVILAHNHPSGNPQPSLSDIRRTQDLKRAMGAFDIDVTDHIIIGADTAYSFSEENVFTIR